MSGAAVAGLGLCASGFPSVETWLARIPQPADPAADNAAGAAVLDKASRRRGSLLTRALATAYQQSLAEARLDPASVGSVFGLALGEASTMIGLLDQMWKKDGILSPMRFAGSVHNTASGAISIGTRNTGITTSIAADFDTPAATLLEAIAIVVTHGVPVIAVCGDEAAPADLVIGDQGWDWLACAIALVPAEGAHPGLTRVAAPRRGEPTLAPRPMPDALAKNPNAGMLDLVDALREGRSGSLRLDRGRGRGYCVDIARPV